MSLSPTLAEPWKVIAEPSGYLIAPLGAERVGDVSNVVFTNGAIARDNGELYIYYASSDTRCMWPPPRWKSCWITLSTPRPTRCAAATAWPSGAR